MSTVKLCRVFALLCCRLWVEVESVIDDWLRVCRTTDKREFDLPSLTWLHIFLLPFCIASMTAAMKTASPLGAFLPPTAQAHPCLTVPGC